MERSISKDIERAFIPKKEEEIKPKLVRPRNLEAHFKHILQEKRYTAPPADDEDRGYDDRQRFGNEKQKYGAEWKNEKNKQPEGKSLGRTKSNPIKGPEHDGRYHENDHMGSGKAAERSKYIGDDDDSVRYRENLTDKQKYRESILEKQRNVQNVYRDRQMDEGYHRKDAHSSHNVHEPISKSQPRIKSKYDNVKADYKEDTTLDRKGYRHKGKMPPNYDMEFDRNPYKEPESLPYRESIERMIKSPAMRYKSFEDNSHRDFDYDDERVTPEKERYHVYPPTEKMRDLRPYQHDPREYSHSPVTYEVDEHHASRPRYREPNKRSVSRSPDTVMRVSPKDRFENAKEKFQAIERDRPYIKEKAKSSRRSMDPPGRGSMEAMPVAHTGGRHLPPHQHDAMLDWSSEEDHHDYNRTPPPPPLSNRSKEHYEKNPSSRMAPAKSLGNLVKGYRHSYAEPRNPMPRNSGRVGLAAVNPF